MSTKTQRMRTPLGRVRGHGAAGSGTTHFWHQRLTAVSNVVLTIGMIVVCISLLGRNHAYVVQILGSPLVAILVMLFIVSAVYHMRLGMQVIIEDYVHDDLPKIACLMATTFFCFAIAFASLFAILKLLSGV
ncbi:MAG: succinate dehydrogenase hydrophobic rane anchor protein subunit [Xanthobacteraceae bacterium]|nr:succinate dehydrogenase hydrophobic rane anchor protein subunit [Xanthobacteraceae bacterium]